MQSQTQEIKDAAALEMALDTGIDYDKCKDLISIFLSDAAEPQLVRLEIKPEFVQSRKLKNIVHTKGNCDAVDFAEAITIAVGGILAESRTELVITVIHAGLFFVKVFRKATTIRLSAVDGAIILAMYRLGGQNIMLNEIESKLRDVESEVGVSSELAARLAELKRLGCINEADGRWYIAETIVN